MRELYQRYIKCAITARLLPFRATNRHEAVNILKKQGLIKEIHFSLTRPSEINLAAGKLASTIRFTDWSIFGADFLDKGIKACTVFSEQSIE